MKFTETNINQAFQPLIESLTTQYDKHIRRMVNKYLEHKDQLTYPRMPFNYTSLDVTLSNYWKQFQNVLSVHEKNNPKDVSVYYLCEDSLSEKAKEWAHNQVTSMITKTVQKIDDLDDIKLSFYGNGNFKISDKNNDCMVCAEQQTVIKQNNKGTIFAQFPMRIYVDGKFTPAAKYRESIISTTK